MTIARKSLGAYAALMSAGLLLAGCSNWSYNPGLRGTYIDAGMNLSRAQAAAPAPGVTAFSADLGKDYAGFANSLLNKEGQMADTDYFARKSLAAYAGKNVPPENVGNWAIATPLEAPVGYDVVMNDTRKRLMGFLDANRAGNPAVASHAQVLFDCWVEHTEWQINIGFNGSCHAQLMAILGGPAAAATANVYFEFNRSTLSPAAVQIVQQVALAAKNEPDAHVMLIGKADLAGTDAYNMGLSHRRADAVRAELDKDGIANTRIDERWVGEREPPVPTPNGVREPRNRVVEITIQ
jgi:OOP family OmpA-OmpF porin